MVDGNPPEDRIGIGAFEQVVLQHSTDAALLLHPTDGVVYASPAAEHVIGIPAHDFLGKLAADWVHPDDVPAAIAQRQLAATVGHSGPILIRGRHGDGTHHWFEAEWWHLATEHTVLHLRDAHRHRSAIEALRAEVSLDHALRDLGQELSFTISPDGRHLHHLGAATRRLLGIAANDTRTLEWFDIVAPDHQARFAMLLDEARHSRGAVSATVALTDGTSVWTVDARVHDLTADPRVAALAVLALRHSP